MFGIRNTFKHLLGRAATAAFNKVVSYLDNFCADESIDFHRPDSPSAENPPCIGVNKAWLSAVIAETGGSLSGVGANNLVGTDGDADPVAVAAIPTVANNNWHKALYLERGGTTLSFQATPLVAENPGSAVDSVSVTASRTTALTGTHTFSTSTTNGFKFPVVTHVSWDGTSLKYFYRFLTIDKYGRMYSVSGETAVTVDTPTKVTWS